MSAALDELAAGAAARLIRWMDGRVDESRREWIAALAAETDEMDGGWEKLRWALSGVTLAWSFRRAPEPQLQVAGIGNELVDRYRLWIAVRQHGWDAMTLLLSAAALVVVGLFTKFGLLVVFAPLASSLLLFPYARSLEGWRRTLVLVVAMSAFGSSLYQMWLPAQGKREDAQVLFAGEPVTKQNAQQTVHFYSLSGQAKLSFTRGEVEDARVYASRLLEMAPRYLGDWNYGNAIHDGNLVLGRIAVRSGNLAEAKRRLLAAGRTPGSANLNSFGPNMALAEDLLKAGERDVVLEYFALCHKFWRGDFGSLAEWSANVRAGRRPQFGANLRY